MATNQLHVLERVDHIAVLERKALRAQGSYATLKQDAEVAAFLQMREGAASVDDAADAAAAASGAAERAPDAAEAAKSEGDSPIAAEAEAEAEEIASGAIASSVYAEYAASLGWGNILAFNAILTLAYGARQTRAAPRLHRIWLRSVQRIHTKDSK